MNCYKMLNCGFAQDGLAIMPAVTAMPTASAITPTASAITPAVLAVPSHQHMTDQPSNIILLQKQKLFLRIVQQQIITLEMACDFAESGEIYQECIRMISELRDMETSIHEQIG